MRTSAIRWPDTSKRRASPEARSSGAQSATVSDTGGQGSAAQRDVETLVHLALQERNDFRNRRAVDDGVEEATHDETLGHFGRHAARLNVVTLVLVDRPHRRGVGAADVVLQYVEIGHGVGVRPFVEDEVVVGLAGVAAYGTAVHPDQPAVDRARRPCDRTLAQQLA